MSTKERGDVTRGTDATNAPIDVGCSYPPGEQDAPTPAAIGAAGWGSAVGSRFNGTTWHPCIRVMVRVSRLCARAEIRVSD